MRWVFKNCLAIERRMRERTANRGRKEENSEYAFLITMIIDIVERRN